MPFNQISCKTFCKRWFGCSYYTQSPSYSKTIDLIFDRTLKDQASTERPFIDCFVDHYNSRCLTGVRSIYAEDSEEFDIKCTTMAMSMSSFLSKYEAHHIRDSYLFRGRINGRVGCIIKNEKSSYVVDFSYSNTQDTYNNIGYYKLNLYLYNITHDLTHDGMVYIPESNSYYMIKFNPSDYTIRRGFLQTIIKNRAYNPGYQCLTCEVKDCKPRLIIRRNI